LVRACCTQINHFKTKTQQKLLILVILIKLEIISISLSNGLESYIKNKVATGDYIKEQDEKKQALMSALQLGFGDIEAGRISTQTIDEIFDEAVAKRNDVKTLWQKGLNKTYLILLTIYKWGYNQAEIYKEKLKEAEKEIAQNPHSYLSKSRNDLRTGLRSFFAGRHIFFYYIKDENTIEVIRVLHQAMDYKRHL